MFKANSEQDLVVSGARYGEFDVFSTAPGSGKVNFSIVHTTGQLVGTTVNGPVAPEPSTWAMMAMGFVALGFLRARNSSCVSPTPKPHDEPDARDRPGVAAPAELPSPDRADT